MSDQEILNLLCPVRALDSYGHRAAQWCKSDQLLVCFGSPRPGPPASKQRISKRIIKAISLAYEAHSLPRSMVASKALLSGVSLQEVCDAVGWVSPHTYLYDFIAWTWTPNWVPWEGNKILLCLAILSACRWATSANQKLAMFGPGILYSFLVFTSGLFCCYINLK